MRISEIARIPQLDPSMKTALASDRFRHRVARGSMIEGVNAKRAAIHESFLAIRAMQHSTYFESAAARVLDGPLRGLTYAAVALCTTPEARL
jgi:hypothetical protein